MFEWCKEVERKLLLDFFLRERGVLLGKLTYRRRKKKKDAKSFERAESGRKLKLNKPDEGEEAVKLVAGCSQSVSALESNQKISCRRKTKVD